MSLSRHCQPLLLLFLGATLLSACATPLSPEAESIREVRASEVSGCDKVARVSGTAEGFYLSPTAQLQQAQNAALEKAVEANATHVVWTSLEEELSSYVAADAYRCRKTG
ncbi:MAG: hypothetical protein R3296_11825 [Oleiphilaceae bacterium]|nr:hypothetical protein [Oleiphilaceae bacterium]